MSRKYPKTTGYYNYAHILPNKLVYFGYSKQETCDRWQPKEYKSTVLYPYIQHYGWENIKHIVIQDGLTKEQAKAIEGVLIKQGKIDGFCINRQNSGNKSRKEHLYDYNHSDKGYECRKRYLQSEKGIEIRKKRMTALEWKIYNRVDGHNRRHPENVVETPLEAKNKYLEYGYIPSYIKNDDLK